MASTRSLRIAPGCAGREARGENRDARARSSAAPRLPGGQEAEVRKASSALSLCTGPKTLSSSPVASRRGAGRFERPEADSKPGSVPAPSRLGAGEDHSSRRRIAAPLERSHPDAGAVPNGSGAALRTSRPRRRPYSSLLREGLAPPPVTRLSRVSSYLTISPLPVPPRRSLTRSAASPAIGGVVSVALSLGSPRVAVSDLPALWSPDFPPAGGDCLPAILRPPPVGGQSSGLLVGKAGGPPSAPRPPDRPWLAEAAAGRLRLRVHVATGISIR